MQRTQAFLLILAASFLAILLYVLNPSLNKSARDFSLREFSKDTTIMLTGDVMLGRTVMSKSLDLGDPAYPFRKVAETLSQADFVFINLESPIISLCPRSTSGFKFCADPKMVEGLSLSGVDVVGLANNHSKDYGETGLEETVRFLTAAGIEVVGLGNLAVKERKGIKLGFLAFDFVSKSPKEEDFRLVSDSDKKVDVLVVGVHWGEEYQERANKFQREWAKRLVKAGADVIVGHHPHWVQDEEKIEGKPVYYSLGNFVFDQMWSEKTKQGLVVKLTFKDGVLLREEKLPIYISSWAQPEFK